MKTFLFIALFAVLSWAQNRAGVVVSSGASGMWGLKNESFFVSSAENPNVKRGFTSSPLGFTNFALKFDHIQYGVGLTHTLNKGVSPLISIVTVSYDHSGPYVGGSYIFNYGHETYLSPSTLEDAKHDFDAISVESGYSLKLFPGFIRMGMGAIWGRGSEVMFVPSPYIGITIGTES